MFGKNGKWFAVAFLLLIVTLGLLVAYQWIGTQPSSPEVINVQAIKWNMTRPSGHVDVDEAVENFYVDEGTSIKLAIHIYDYQEGSAAWPFNYRDGLTMRVFGEVNVSGASLESVNIRISNLDNSSFLRISQHPDSVGSVNLGVEEIRDYVEEPYVRAVALNKSDHYELSVQVYWIFLDIEHTANHHTTINLEVTYSNKTGYYKAVIPIKIEVTAA